MQTTNGAQRRGNDNVGNAILYLIVMDVASYGWYDFLATDV